MEASSPEQEPPGNISYCRNLRVGEYEVRLHSLRNGKSMQAHKRNTHLP